jgi:hypothetical protein
MTYYIEYTRMDDPEYRIQTLGPVSLSTARLKARLLSKDDNIGIAYIVDEHRCGHIAYYGGSFYERDGATI